MTCRIVRLLDDGTPVVEFPDGERAVRIHGVDVPTPMPQRYAQIVVDPPNAAHPTRCEPVAEDTARFHYYGWQDKSGDVWVDLAATLLKEGLVRVRDGSFPERDEYLQYESEAREQRLGIWG